MTEQSENSKIKYFHIGTGRAGSTFLFHLLKNHPNLVLPENQEIGYFSDYFDKGLDWYQSQFDTNENRIDTSPAYFVRGDMVAKRISEYLDGQEPKFLLILRNPVDYTFSNFHLRKNNGYFERHKSTYPKTPKSYEDLLSLYPEYLDSGKYFKNLSEGWYPYFNKKSFKIVKFEDLVKKPQKTVNDIFSFFDLETVTVTTPEISKNATLRYPWLYKLRAKIVKFNLLKNLLKNSKVFNQFYQKNLTSRVTLSPETRKKAIPHFESDLRNLEQETGLDLSSWYTE